MEHNGQSQMEKEEAKTDVRNIENDVAIISVLKSKIIQLKAVARERQVSANFQPDMMGITNKFEAELSRVLIHRKLAKTCLQSAALHLLLGQETEISQTVISLLKRYGDLVEELGKLEINEVNVELMKKRMEYVDTLDAFKKMLEEHKELRQSSKQYTERIRMKETLSQKLEKLNIMRMLMLNIICNSDIDYVQNPKYSEMASRLLEPITFQRINVRLTE